MIPNELSRMAPRVFSDAALEVLERSEYKGNVRELEGIILSAFLWARHQGAARIEVDHLPKKVRQTWVIIVTEIARQIASRWHEHCNWRVAT